MRSRGSVLLARTAKTQAEIATRVGVSRVAVSHWLNGNGKPISKMRKKLRTIYAVPEESWDERHTNGANGTNGTNGFHHTNGATTDEEIPDGVLAKADALERMAHDLMSNVKNDPDSTPLEKARVMNAIASTLNILAKMTGQFDIGTRLFRLPLWKQIETALAVGLEGHPEAAAAVAREFRKLDSEHR